ncbi:MAG: hypothetical protein J7L25_10490 [Deltaproteobacteria bacterium]|nr:hypothetical protein [Candidatus Tharpella aukensis]
MTDSHAKIIFTGPDYRTKVVHYLANGVQKIVTSRRYRKGRGAKIVLRAGTQSEPGKHKNPWLSFWAPMRLTWWVAILFTIGSALFSAGGYSLTFPNHLPATFTEHISLDWLFFGGSIFFTIAAYCQLLEAVNAGDSEGLYSE